MIVRRFVSGSRQVGSGCFDTSEDRGAGCTGSQLSRAELTLAPLHYDAYSSTHARILLSGRCQAAVRQPVRDSQSVFRTSRAAVVIEGSIVRLEPSVEGVRNFQTCHICPSGGFQAFLPAGQAKTVVLRGIFRHLVLQHKSIVQYSVGFKSWVRTWAPSFENISKSYSHVLFLNTKMAKKSPKTA